MVNNPDSIGVGRTYTDFTIPLGLKPDTTLTIGVKPDDNYFLSEERFNVWNRIKDKVSKENKAHTVSIDNSRMSLTVRISVTYSL